MNTNDITELHWKIYDAACDEQDELIDRLIMQANNDIPELNRSTSAEENAEALKQLVQAGKITQDDVKQMCSINRRKMYMSKLDPKHLASTELKATIENDQQLELAAREEREYRAEQLSRKTAEEQSDVK